MKTAHIFVEGTVQRIGYRQFVKATAKNNNVTGWVRNLSDGRVEAMLQGSEEDVETVILQGKKGPFLADVKDVDVSWLETSEKFDDFTILPTI